MMRKMQVPAYCPVPEGAHCVEKSGVEVEEKKVIIISDIPIIFVELEGVGGIFILPVDDELPQHKSRKPMSCEWKGQMRGVRMLEVLTVCYFEKSGRFVSAPLKLSKENER
ncbi:hypothetical protein MMC21_002687 [Puttea exsequens]|nr:hypothetical protein [Puttea exsequens]